LGWCPIHGRPLALLERFTEPLGGRFDGDEVAIVQCLQPDCPVRAYAKTPFGPWELLPEFEHLVDDGS
jgi:hypothetical protein